MLEISKVDTLYKDVDCTLREVQVQGLKDTVTRREQDAKHYQDNMINALSTAKADSRRLNRHIDAAGSLHRALFSSGTCRSLNMTLSNIYDTLSNAVLYREDLNAASAELRDAREKLNTTGFEGGEVVLSRELLEQTLAEHNIEPPYYVGITGLNAHPAGETVEASQFCMLKLSTSKYRAYLSYRGKFTVMVAPGSETAARNLLNAADRMSAGYKFKHAEWPGAFSITRSALVDTMRAFSKLMVNVEHEENR